MLQTPGAVGGFCFSCTGALGKIRFSKSYWDLQSDQHLSMFLLDHGQTLAQLLPLRLGQYMWFNEKGRLGVQTSWDEKKGEPILRKIQDS